MPKPKPVTKEAQRAIDRAFECLKKHPELGRVFKKDLVALESHESNGLVRTALVRDKYSKRTFACGETSYSYFEAVVVD